jgi:hypothetical protein
MSPSFAVIEYNTGRRRRNCNQPMGKHSTQGNPHDSHKRNQNSSKRKRTQQEQEEENARELAAMITSSGGRRIDVVVITKRNDSDSYAETDKHLKLRC